jgi:hypothetical protein
LVDDSSKAVASLRKVDNSHSLLRSFNKQNMYCNSYKFQYIAIFADSKPGKPQRKLA